MDIFGLIIPEFSQKLWRSLGFSKCRRCKGDMPDLSGKRTDDNFIVLLLKGIVICNTLFILNLKKKGFEV